MYLHLLMELALFQSTHPVRGATHLSADYYPIYDISIHAPREGCDCPPRLHYIRGHNFNPRTP